MVGGMASNIVGVITGKQRIGHDVVIERFVDSVLNDSKPPVTGEEGRGTVRVMEMVVERYREKYGDKVE
jgi:predicted dehydrogenase